MKNSLTDKPADDSNNSDFSLIKKNNRMIRPFVHFSCSASSSIIVFFIFLIPQIAMLLLNGVYSALYIILCAVLGSVCAEIVNDMLLKERFYGIPSIVQGILIGLLLPSNYPLVSVLFLCFISILIFKYAFGGYAHPWINPVAITVALAWIFNISCFPSFLVTKEQLFNQNPSLMLIQNGTIPILPFDNKITSFLNQKLFNNFGVSLPDGYISFLWDTNSIIPAFRFNIITLLTSAVFFAFDFVCIIVPACFITMYCAAVYFLSPAFFPTITDSGDVILALFSSGTLFCALYLLPWIGTTPSSVSGKIIYGIIAGMIAFFITGCGTSPAGAVFTIILSNIVSLFIQEIEDFFARRKMKYLLKKEITVIMED